MSHAQRRLLLEACAIELANFADGLIARFVVRMGEAQHPGRFVHHRAIRRAPLTARAPCREALREARRDVGAQEVVELFGRDEVRRLCGSEIDELICDVQLARRARFFHRRRAGRKHRREYQQRKSSTPEHDGME